MNGATSALPLFNGMPTASYSVDTNLNARNGIRSWSSSRVPNVAGLLAGGFIPRQAVHGLHRYSLAAIPAISVLLLSLLLRRRKSVLTWPSRRSKSLTALIMTLETMITEHEGRRPLSSHPRRALLVRRIAFRRR